jgi:malate dehydrogenase (oxaloacetate-decarboxylating)
MPNMEDEGLFEREAADVADQAVKEGLARSPMSPERVWEKTHVDIMAARKMFKDMTDSGAIEPPPQAMLQEALVWALGR